MHFAGSTTDSYSQDRHLSDAGVQAVVSGAISSGRLPKDTNAVYFVLTSADVNETSGFCTQYCGWHTHGTIPGSDIKYSFVGNPDRCPSACAAQTTGPNGNAGADGMASIIAHELEEAVTDPDLNAWYDRRGAENADKCAWTFGTTYSVERGVGQHEAGSTRLPHPAELGERVRRLLRPVILTESRAVRRAIRLFVGLVALSALFVTAWQLSPPTSRRPAAV